ncbi:PLDc N-terminal domain-containing protein [Roseospira visakhapatnamensis]|uniref:Cardiolipin synthase N-terminal domain-containing protein n=1 Tax=Roseospira visakhapatnamensis TaxID=390880 RepID=A0A7W6RF49_9PROT|nr:PLDc N-terminal domain-containing protein [Roseospira visakhapatnamensis]MBB4266788.1 hypothetical protein [Roseospira visakhapatnamensis]
MFGLELGLFGLLSLVLFLWAAIHVLGSTASPLGKALWVAVLLFLPLLGFLLWLFLGPRSAR